MEIWFYHLTRQKLERTLPTLLERSVQRGWKAVVQASSEARMNALDDLLWTYSDDGFLAHGTERDGDAHLQQVWLTTGADNPNDAKVRFFVEDAEIAPVIAVSANYDRVILMFDGNDEAELQGARKQWKVLKDQGRDLSYWKQSDSGGWEKMAL
jgi:DNA polymerase-3 subunit chi